MTTVLGIGLGLHDTGAALVTEDGPQAAVNEERLSRVKRESRFPSAAINHILQEADQPITGVCVSGVANDQTARTVLKETRSALRGAGSVSRVLRSAYTTSMEPRRTLEDVKERLEVETRLEIPAVDVGRNLLYVDHHRAHAATAYYTSGFSEATIATIDAAGDGLSSTIYEGRDGSLSMVAANDEVDSIGKIWAQLPTLFGFKASKHAGKFMGMAAYTPDPPPGLREIFESILQVDGLSIENHFERKHDGKGYEEKVLAWQDILGQYDAPEVASALQMRTEEVLQAYLEAAVDQTQIPNVALAGGVVANVKVNQQIFELDDVDRIFVHQNMGDGGLGVGAGLAAIADRRGGLEPRFLGDVYLGAAPSKRAVEGALAGRDLKPEYTVECFQDRDELADEAAAYLAQGAVVSLFHGRMEYGPRALGNRTILYQPTDPSAIEWLNQRLDRTEFMPFAPVTLREHAEECYRGYDPEACPAADFMTITFDCTDRMKKRSPGVVHVDGTARPQVIDEDTNPFYYRVLARYHGRTGLPTLINTSFNMHGEPIVCSPAQALESFLQTGNEALILEDYLISKRQEGDA